ncbi:MAG: LeuA family protein, partial [Myxococcales bacterium]
GTPRAGAKAARRNQIDQVRGGVSRDELIFDWNLLDARAPFTARPFELNDESLRDGVQSPSVVDPRIEDKIELVELMAELGITRLDIGLPGAGRRAQEDVLALARHIARKNLPLKPNCAARTVEADIAPVAALQQAAGIPISVYTFIGSSPIRQYAEDWGVDRLLKTSADAISFAVKQGLENAYVTEDTIRSHPRTLDRLFRNAIDHGTSALVLCDTVGHATPEGVEKLIGWTRNLVLGTGAKVRIEWHGHNDRGLAVINSLAAIRAGADVVHGCALGIGERVGNASMDQILLNLKLLGAWDRDLTKLVRYVQVASRATEVPIPRNYPLSGEDAFRTATGVHAAAIIKAKNLGDMWLVDRVYSGVPASEFGKDQTIEIGHMSGMSNVKFWLTSRDLPFDDDTCNRILKHAKQSNRTLTEAEVLALLPGRAPKTARKRA